MDVCKSRGPLPMIGVSWLPLKHQPKLDPDCSLLGLCHIRRMPCHAFGEFYSWYKVRLWPLRRPAAPIRLEGFPFKVDRFFPRIWGAVAFPQKLLCADHRQESRKESARASRIFSGATCRRVAAPWTSGDFAGRESSSFGESINKMHLKDASRNRWAGLRYVSKRRDFQPTSRRVPSKTHIHSHTGMSVLRVPFAGYFEGDANESHPFWAS